MLHYSSCFEICTVYFEWAQCPSAKCLCCMATTVSTSERGGAQRATGSVANNTQVIISPKGAPALSEVGQDAAGDGVKQLNNAKAHRSWCLGQVSTLCRCVCCVHILKKKRLSFSFFGFSFYKWQPLVTTFLLKISNQEEDCIWMRFKQTLSFEDESGRKRLCYTKTNRGPSWLVYIGPQVTYNRAW